MMMASGMKVLVTGGAGFIGSHTCDRLLSQGHEVIVLDALTPPVHRNGRPAYLSREADFYTGDVRNRDHVTSLLRRVDAVYHVAAYQDYLPDFARPGRVGGGVRRVAGGRRRSRRSARRSRREGSRARSGQEGEGMKSAFQRAQRERAARSRRART
jgi:uncharacterized protein YbjT (DUF2867 family)